VKFIGLPWTPQLEESLKAPFHTASANIPLDLRNGSRRSQCYIDILLCSSLKVALRPAFRTPGAYIYQGGSVADHLAPSAPLLSSLSNHRLHVTYRLSLDPQLEAGLQVACVYCRSSFIIGSR